MALETEHNPHYQYHPCSHGIDPLLCAKCEAFSEYISERVLELEIEEMEELEAEDG